MEQDSHLRSAIDEHRKAIMEEHGFSPRECEVCHAILNGETRASAAEKLFIAERTVKFHLENCYKKLGVNSKSELIKRFYVAPSPLDSID